MAGREAEEDAAEEEEIGWAGRTSSTLVLPSMSCREGAGVLEAAAASGGVAAARRRCCAKAGRAAKNAAVAGDDASNNRDGRMGGGTKDGAAGPSKPATGAGAGRTGACEWAGPPPRVPRLRRVAVRPGSMGRANGTGSNSVGLVADRRNIGRG